MTPLAKAAEANQIGAVQLLLQAAGSSGAENAVAVHAAARAGAVDALEVLFESNPVRLCMPRGGAARAGARVRRCIVCWLLATVACLTRPASCVAAPAPPTWRHIHAESGRGFE